MRCRQVQIASMSSGEALQAHTFRKKSTVVIKVTYDGIAIRKTIKVGPIFCTSTANRRWFVLLWSTIYFITWHYIINTTSVNEFLMDRHQPRGKTDWDKLLKLHDGGATFLDTMEIHPTVRSLIIKAINQESQLPSNDNQPGTKISTIHTFWVKSGVQPSVSVCVSITKQFVKHDKVFNWN